LKSLGSRLRQLRARHRWTLREMSAKTAIPLSTLAKVEKDRLTLSYEKLVQLSERLGIPLRELFGDGETGVGSTATGRRSIGLLSQAKHVNAGKYDHYYMCSELRNKRMVPILTRIRAASLEEHGPLQHHPGEKYFYVLEGCVCIYSEFYEPITLRSQESLYIDGNMGHACLAEGCAEAVALVVCSDLG
jgi:transcriptional regulator with XRE-family HTH domain